MALYIKKVKKWKGKKPKDTYFAKAEETSNSCIQYHFTNFQGIVLDKMHPEFSKVATAAHASPVLMNCKQQSNESLTSFIYRWGQLFLQSCGMTAEQCVDKLKLELSPYNYLMKG